MQARRGIFACFFRLTYLLLDFAELTSRYPFTLKILAQMVDHRPFEALAKVRLKVTICFVRIKFHYRFTDPKQSNLNSIAFVEHRGNFTCHADNEGNNAGMNHIHSLRVARLCPGYQSMVASSVKSASVSSLYIKVHRDSKPVYRGTA